MKDALIYAPSVALGPARQDVFCTLRSSEAQKSVVVHSNPVEKGAALLWHKIALILNTNGFWVQMCRFDVYLNP